MAYAPISDALPWSVCTKTLGASDSEKTSRIFCGLPIGEAIVSDNTNHTSTKKVRCMKRRRVCVAGFIADAVSIARCYTPHAPLSISHFM